MMQGFAFIWINVIVLHFGIPEVYKRSRVHFNVECKSFLAKDRAVRVL